MRSLAGFTPIAPGVGSAPTAAASASDRAGAVIASPVQGFEFAGAVVTVTDPQSIQAESIRTLRSNLMAQHIDQGRRAFAVVSPTERTGCSFIAANLAVALSQVGLRVLLVDANLREPGIAELIRPDLGVAGLAETLDGGAGADAIQTVSDRLSLLYAGQASAQTLDRMSGGMTELADGWMRRFDVTLFDTPPASLYADARRVASAAGAAIIVARRAYSFRRDIQFLVNELKDDGVVVAGTYLNDY